MKRFVHEAVDEALKLESALAKLRTAHRIALLHYSPIAATVMGEPLENLSFLGVEPGAGAVESIFRDRCLSRSRASWRP